MLIDGKLESGSPSAIADSAREHEAVGYSGLWTSESNHDPFLPLTVAAEHTTSIEIGTSIAVAFARSPMTVAYTAWDLQRMSNGRLVLGLGSQVKPHIERRFSMPWGRPAGQMREFVGALRAIWASWQDGTRLNFEGEFYRHTLMTSFFAPPPLEVAPPKVVLAAVGEAMCELVGESCDGIFLHAFTTDRYIREVTLPAIERGLLRTGRTSDEIQIFGLPLIATGLDDEALQRAVAAVRQQIAFYGSTTAYRAVLELHGWGELGDELHALSLGRDPDRWTTMSSLIDDTVLHTFAIVGQPGQIARQLIERFAGVVNRIKFYAPYDHDFSLWTPIVTELAGSGRPRHPRFAQSAIGQSTPVTPDQGGLT